jgi:NADPH:quinone reductase-like Zn-dependent oxidoreductase
MGHNPSHHILQDISLPFVKYPVILGEDIAGTIEAVGSEASAHFQIHDRVLAFAQGATRGPAMGGFQEYVVVDMAFTCGMPEGMSFAEASVFPVGVYDGGSCAV